MIKKCIAKYDELGKPIEIIELKDFNDPQTLKAFKEKCDANKVEYLKRQDEKAKKEQLYKEKVAQDINSLQEEIVCLKLVISHILGYEEFAEDYIRKVLDIPGDGSSLENEATDIDYAVLVEPIETNTEPVEEEE